MHDEPHELPPENNGDPEDYLDYADYETEEAEGSTARDVLYRGATSDPLFGLLVAGAVTIGLSPLTGTESFDLRYSVSWALLAGFGVLSWLFGSAARIDREQPENLAWGAVFGLILAVPLLAFLGGTTLTEATELLFMEMSAGTVMAYVVFVMPLSETLFFRGVFQQTRAFWETAIYCTVFQFILFFPMMNQGPYPLIIGIGLVMANLMYGYVRDRNGLAAAWVCQITVNLVLFFIPALMS